MAEGIQLRLTHTGLSASNLLIDDIRGDTSAGGRRGLPPEYVYLPAPTAAVPNPQITITYGGAVPMSFERGDIRKYIEGGHLTAEFLFGNLVVAGIKFVVIVPVSAPGPYEASAGELVEADASTNPLTVNLPAAPSVGDRVTINKIDASGNAVTVDGNGTNINGAATFPLLVQYDSLTVVRGTAQWWIV